MSTESSGEATVASSGARSSSSSSSSSSPRRLAAPKKKYLSVEELDAPFHTEHVFWHLMRTYVGLGNMVLKVQELEGRDKEAAEAAIEIERQLETKSSAASAIGYA